MISGEEKNYDQALAEFRRAAMANPNNLLPVQNMMGIYEYQGRAADAQKVLGELVAEAPRNADLHLGLARTLIAQSHVEEGCKELDFNRPLINLAIIYQRLGQPEKGRQLLADFLAQHPGDADVRKALDSVAAR